MFGKVKTVAQMIAIIAAIFMANPVLFPAQETTVIITNVLVWISTIITVISGIDYMVKNIGVFKN